MKTNPNRVRDTERDALIKRTNRKLTAKGQMVRVVSVRHNPTASHHMKTFYHIEDMNSRLPAFERQIVRVDIHALGAELGVLAKAAAAGK